jgi:hypothetical protein
MKLPDGGRHADNFRSKAGEWRRDLSFDQGSIKAVTALFLANVKD